MSNLPHFPFDSDPPRRIKDDSPGDRASIFALLLTVVVVLSVWIGIEIGRAMAAGLIR